MDVWVSVVDVKFISYSESEQLNLKALSKLLYLLPRKRTFFSQGLCAKYQKHNPHVH